MISWLHSRRICLELANSSTGLFFGYLRDLFGIVSIAFHIHFYNILYFGRFVMFYMMYLKKNRTLNKKKTLQSEQVNTFQ